MTSQTSSLNLNMAIKNGKQPNNSIPVEDCRLEHTKKELSQTF